MRGFIYTESEAGCCGDGALGHQHCRIELLATLLHTNADAYERGYSGLAWTDDEQDNLLESLEGPMPDDTWDEREALDLLNSVTDTERVRWGFQGVDFGLWPIEA